ERRRRWRLARRRLHLAGLAERVPGGLTDAYIVPARNHAGGDGIAGAQLPAAFRAFHEREGGRAERALARERDAVPHELAVHERLRTDLFERPPVLDLGPDDHAPVVAEIGDDGARAEIVERR